MPITDEGYVVDTVPEIVDAMSSEAKTSYEDQDLDTSDNSLLGILFGVSAIQENQHSQAIAELFNSQDPDTAEGKSLDNLAYRNGIIRKGALPSTATVTFTNNSSVEQVLSAGSQVNSTGGYSFTTDETITIASTVGSTQDVQVTALESGPIPAPATTINDFPSGGELITVSNAEAASLGSDRESDTALRIRLKRFLQAGGNCTENALASAISNLAGVTDVAVIANPTAEFISRGDGRLQRPPHSFETVVEGGTDSQVAEVIALSGAGGIQAFGDTSYRVDSLSKTVAFTRPEVFDIKLNLVYDVYDEESLPNGVDALLKSQAVAFSETEFSLGKDILVQRITCEALRGISGVGKVQGSVSLDGVNFTSECIIMEAFQKGRLSDEDITVTRQISFG